MEQKLSVLRIGGLSRGYAVSWSCFVSKYDSKIITLQGAGQSIRDSGEEAAFLAVRCPVLPHQRGVRSSWYWRQDIELEVNRLIQAGNFLALETNTKCKPVQAERKAKNNYVVGRKEYILHAFRFLNK